MSVGKSPEGDVRRRRALGGLACEYGERLYRFAYSIMGNHEDARDAVQRTLFAAWKQFQELDASIMKSWLYRTTFNVSQEAVRAGKRFSALPLHEITRPSVTVRDTAEEQEKGDTVRSAVMTLPERQRSVVLLRFYDGLPVREIASIMDITAGGVKANISRGLDSLRQKLANAGLV